MSASTQERIPSRDEWMGQAAEAEAELIKRGAQFDFFQAVRLLDRALAPDVRPGEVGKLQNESIRFRSHVGFDFPPREINQIEAGHSLSETARVTVTTRFLGVLGPLGLGTLPNPYTELVLDRIRERDLRLRDFYDLFNHRLTALFYRAWTKRHPAVSLEQGRFRRALAAGEPQARMERALEADWLTFVIRCIVGLGAQPAGADLGIAEDVLLAHAGAFGLDRTPAGALEAVLEGFFGVRFEVVPFVGRWLDLEQTEKTTLDSGFQISLGDGVVVGDSVWDPAAAFRVRIGPLDFSDFVRFLPSGAAGGDVARLAGLLLGPGCDVDAQLVLKKEQIPPLRLGAEPVEGGPAAYLGWSSWLGDSASQADSDSAIFTLTQKSNHAS